MGKKRKSSNGKPRAQNVDAPSKEDSRRTIKTYTDVADSEDEFFINRDKVLLDESPVQKKRRKIAEEGMCYNTSWKSVCGRCS